MKEIKQTFSEDDFKRKKDEPTQAPVWAPTPTPRNKKKIIFSVVGVFVGVMVLAIVRFLVADAFIKSDFVFGKEMTVMASTLNKNCPMMVDKETRFDNAVALPKKVFQYNYTLVNMSRGDVDTTAVKNSLIPLSANNVRTNPQMKLLKDKKVIFVYSYKDKNGDYIFSFTITPAQYEENTNEAASGS